MPPRSDRNGYINHVKRIIETDHPNLSDGILGSLTALHVAVLERNLLIVKYLVEEAGADVDVRNLEGRTPLLEACSSEDYRDMSKEQRSVLASIIGFLVRSGADVNATDKMSIVPFTLH